LSVVTVVFCKVEVSATDWSPVQRSPTDCEASLCVIRNLENEEAKYRYRAVKIQPQWVVTPGKQTNTNRFVWTVHVTVCRTFCVNANSDQPRGLVVRASDY
jgi:hypothetical protein